MTFYETLGEAFAAIRDWYFANGASFNEEEREVFGGFLALGTSPVDLIVNVAEFIYARRDSYGDDAKSLAAGLMRLGAMNGFHGLNTDGRGEKAAAILEGGEGDAPEPAPRYVRPPAPPAPVGVEG